MRTTICVHARFRWLSDIDGKRQSVQCCDCPVIFTLPIGIRTEEEPVRIPVDGTWHEADWYFRERYPKYFDERSRA